MWIHYIDKIMIGVFVILILAHFGLHFYFKYVKHKQKARKSKTNAAKSLSE